MEENTVVVGPEPNRRRREFAAGVLDSLFETLLIRALGQWGFLVRNGRAVPGEGLATCTFIGVVLR